MSVKRTSPVTLVIACMLAAALLGGCTHMELLGASENGSSGSAGDMSGTMAPDGAYSASELYCEIEPIEPDPHRPLGDTEEYSSLDEPGFVSTAIAPISTFSADVDTASYCNIRRMVREGSEAEAIPNGAVRIEEMLNYFDYDYALPAADDLFGVTTQIAACPWNPETKLLVMGFATKPVEYGRTAGANLVFLIDTSGSMGDPEKLPLLKDSFAELVDGLTERDRVSIVTYSGTERIVLEGASGADKRTITRAIDGLVAEGSTNGEAGLEMAYRVAERSYLDGGVNRIVMASDGDLNVGITSESDLHDYVRDKRDGGVYLSVLGFGSGNYKDNKMETLADNGNGSYHYIDCIEEAEKVFGEDLASTIVPLADDVKLQVEFNPAAIKGYRLIGYENRTLADEDFIDDAVDAGDVGAGHQFTIAYELATTDSAMEVYVPELKYKSRESEDMPDTAGDGEGAEWLTCSMRYKPAGTPVSVERSYPIDEASFTDAPSDDWTFAAAVIECGMTLRDSPHRGSASLHEARTLVERIDLPAGDPKADFERLLMRL